MRTTNELIGTLSVICCSIHIILATDAHFIVGIDEYIAKACVCVRVCAAAVSQQNLHFRIYDTERL